jgi:hypothetical protein
MTGESHDTGDREPNERHDQPHRQPSWLAPRHERLERREQLGTAGEAVARFPAQGAIDDVAQGAGQVRTARAQRRDLRLQPQLAKLAEGRRLVQSHPGRRLVDDHAKRVDVSGGTDVGPARELLGGHVLRGSDDDSFACELEGRGVVAGGGRLLDGPVGARHAEVRHHRMAVTVPEDHVRRLEVPMRDPRFVCGREGAREVERQPHDLVTRQSSAREALVERLAVDQLHRQPEASR